MTIKLIIGNVGSGKTAFAVREMMAYSKYMPIYTNIETKKIKNINLLKPEFIIKKELIKTIKRKNGNEEPVYEMKPNIDFWVNHPKPLSIYIDEAHEFFSARRSMSKTNQRFSSWLRLIRRFLEDKSGMSGDLVLITQLTRSVDIIYREMVNEVIFLISYWTNICTKCGFKWQDNSYSKLGDQKFCYRCGNFGIKKIDFYTNHKAFNSVDDANDFLEFGKRTWIAHKHYYIMDMHDIFNKYDTHQINNILSEFY